VISDEEGRALAIVPFTAVFAEAPEEVGISEDFHRDSPPWACAERARRL